jgi:hypothetical protein
MYRRVIELRSLKQTQSDNSVCRTGYNYRNSRILVAAVQIPVHDFFHTEKIPATVQSISKVYSLSGRPAHEAYKRKTFCRSIPV